MYFTSIPSFILLTRVGPEILKQPIFFLYVDPVTLIRVRGQQQKYQCVEFHGGYNHTKFDYARYHSMRDNPNVKFASTSGRPNTDHYIDSHFFNVSQKPKKSKQ